jgi:hypothetical protein
MMDADFGAAQAGEIFLGLVGAGAVKAVSLRVVDTLHFKTFVQTIPRIGFVGMNNGAFGAASADE